MAKEELQAAIAELGITMTATFVPWSKSRNAKPAPKMSDRSLNWSITLHRDSGGHRREVITTDYSAGIAHCPSYNQVDAMRPTMAFAEKIARETEEGRSAMGFRKVILPDIIDVIYSLTVDSSVLDSGTFEEWAGEFGYDIDSRKAEGIYRACLDIALRLRAALGDAGLARLRDAAQDY